MGVHFRPADGYVGDLIPFESDGRFWLFYLFDERRNPPTGMPWALVSTTDFITYTDHGIVLPSGGPDAADFNCYTGCVIDAGDQLHLFYTGNNPTHTTADGEAQVVCHATSDHDLTQWQRHPEHTFGAPPTYMPEDWRDPYVYRGSPTEPWTMILAARHATGPGRRRGTVARLTSADLVTWQPATPLWEPHRFITQECPEIFQWGDWWYLIYSEFSDAFQTRYRVATRPEGPWLAPSHDSIDTRARYASKSVARDGRRFLIGWIATREGERDDGDWQWAGDLAALEATQRADGTLAFSLPRELTTSFTGSTTPDLKPLDGSDRIPGTGARDRHAAWIGPYLPDTCLVTAVVDIAPGTHSCGLLIRTDDTGETGYELRLEPLRNRFVLDHWPRRHTGPAQWQIQGDIPHGVEFDRPCQLEPGQHEIEMILEDTILVVIVDQQTAMSARLYNHTAGRIGFFVQDGEATISHFRVSERGDDAT